MQTGKGDEGANGTKNAKANLEYELVVRCCFWCKVRVGRDIGIVEPRRHVDLRLGCNDEVR